MLEVGGARVADSRRCGGVGRRRMTRERFEAWYGSCRKQAGKSPISVRLGAALRIGPVGPA